MALENVDIKKTLIFEGFPYGKIGKNGNKKDFKYFIGYKNNNRVKTLCIELPQRDGYLNSFKENKCMSFLTKGDKLLKKK